MRDFLKTMATALALALPFIYATHINNAVNAEQFVMNVDDVRPVRGGDATAMSTQHRAQRQQQMAQQQGSLRACVTPEEIVAEAKDGAKDEYRGARILTTDEVQRLVAFVFANHGIVFDIDTVVVVYLKTVAVVFSGSGGKVCEFEVVDADAMRDALDRILRQGVS
jgi:hypothetical protein